MKTTRKKKLNFEVIKSNIQEVSKELDEIVESLTLGHPKWNPKHPYCEEFLRIDLSHIYNHMNIAWNARHCASKYYFKGTEGDYCRWRRFPKMSEMDLLPRHSIRKGLKSRHENK